MNSRLRQLFRFGLVGGLNTAVDMVLLFCLVWAGLAVVLANTISTGLALGLSFVLNRSFTFRSDGRRGRQVALFLVVTLFGLWALQPLVIEGLRLVWNGPESVELLVGKLVATVVSMTWNYVLYARLVFPPRQ